MQAEGEGVGVGQTPLEKKFELMSGQLVEQGDVPLRRQLPPSELLKHQ